MELVVEAVLVEVERTGGVIGVHQRSSVAGLVLVGAVVAGLLEMRATFSAVAAASAFVVALLARVACSSVLPSNQARRSSVFAEEIARVALHASRSRRS